MEGAGIMSKETDYIFISKAKQLLEQTTDRYNILPHTTIMRIQDVIDELEDILEEEC